VISTMGFPHEGSSGAPLPELRREMGFRYQGGRWVVAKLCHGPSGQISLSSPEPIKVERLNSLTPVQGVRGGQATPQCATPRPGRLAYVRERVMSAEDLVPPLAANMNAAFKKVRGAIGAADPILADLIVTRIVELAKDAVYDVEELSKRTLSSLKS
jgi:hypothetical protein